MLGVPCCPGINSFKAKWEKIWGGPEERAGVSKGRLLENPRQQLITNWDEGISIPHNLYICAGLTCLVSGLCTLPIVSASATQGPAVTRCHHLQPSGV